MLVVLKGETRLYRFTAERISPPRTPEQKVGVNRFPDRPLTQSILLNPSDSQEYIQFQGAAEGATGTLATAQMDATNTVETSVLVASSVFVTVST